MYAAETGAARRLGKNVVHVLLCSNTSAVDVYCRMIALLLYSLNSNMLGARKYVNYVPVVLAYKLRAVELRSVRGVRRRTLRVAPIAYRYRSRRETRCCERRSGWDVRRRHSRSIHPFNDDPLQARSRRGCFDKEAHRCAVPQNTPVITPTRAH